jgi:NADH-quinone oxidoreductase subunit M
MLWLYGRVIFGKIRNPEIKKLPDLNKTEIYIFSTLVFFIIFFGIYPEPLFNTIEVSINNLIKNYQISLDFHFEKLKI